MKLAPSSSMRLGITLAIVILVSLGGIAYAVWFGRASDGGRGGAIGCALTFLMFFIERPTSRSALQHHSPPKRGARTPEANTDPLILGPPRDLEECIAQFAELKVQTGRIRGSVAAMLDSSSNQQVFLGIASVFATFIWGFGDLLAAALGARQ